MGRFNYCIGGAYSNPAEEIQKVTNEFPEEGKAKTTAKKAKKKKTTKKVV